MKRQSLYIGGALLATTALTTSANAGSILNAYTGNGNTTAPTALTAVNLAAEVFGSTTPSAVTLGPAQFLVSFTNSLTTSFDMELESSNSDFTATTPALELFTRSNGTSIATYLSFSGCTVQLLTERILIEDCLATGGTAANRINAMQVSNVSFNNANGLATVGNSIALSGIVRGQSNNTFETISSGTFATSTNSISDDFVTPNAITINNNATPAFSTVTGTNTSALIGNVYITTAGVAKTLTGSIQNATGASNGMELTVTHGVLTDSAVTSVEYQAAATVSVSSGAFNGNVASFNVAVGAVVDTFDIVVNFDGTTGIASWSAGTLTVVYTSGTATATGAPTATGALASLQRGGFSTQINTAQSTAGTGSTLFQSFVRVVNNGSVAGTVSITVRDDQDGSVYGTFTSSTISPNATVQVSMASIESAIGITPAGQYQLSITGPIDGYAQHVMYNSVDNFFVDLTGFRAANP